MDEQCLDKMVHIPQQTTREQNKDDVVDAECMSQTLTKVFLTTQLQTRDQSATKKGHRDLFEDEQLDGRGHCYSVGDISSKQSKLIVHKLRKLTFFYCPSISTSFPVGGFPQ